MADKAISELVAANQVTPTDLFVLEQSGTAKKLTGQTLENWLLSMVDGHGGIQSIVNQGTSGLKDTYRITLSDGTVFDFIVTNGSKGDKGDKGDTGSPATLKSFTVEYQASASGTSVPSGAWSTTVPVVNQGNYLWTKTTLTFNSGSPAVAYSVARMGLDGSGSVSSVSGVSPDSNGNVALTAQQIGAAPSDIFRNLVFAGDFNACSTPGWHWTQLANCTNTPLGNNVANAYGFLEVIAFAAESDGILQRFTDFPTGKTFVRSSINGWQPWVRVDSLESAPSGYGLGISSMYDLRQITTEADAMAISENGLYGYVGPILATECNQGIIRAEVASDLYKTLWYGDIQGHRLVKHNNYGTWTPWMWENPPMTPGVEYPTTELHQGDIVYTALINVGQSANGSVNFPSTVSVGKIIRSACTIGNIPAKLMVAGDTLGDHADAQGYRVTTAAVTLYCGTNRTDKSTYLQIWYTK